MHVPSKVWSCLSYLANVLTLSAFDGTGSQQPLGGQDIHITPATDAQLSAAAGYPIFKPPGWRVQPDGTEFECKYKNMTAYEFCSSPEDRGCWLRLKEGHFGPVEYNIHTDYEDWMPQGQTRYYEYDIAAGWINADGYKFTDAKLVNNQYPGPYLQACWGDRIVVNVTNRLEFNGTAIHWHGIRQLRTMHMDGVPGITQCPIVPGDHFVYNFTARQYGSAWYHSHYSVQYADGLLGPLTIYGPHSSNWDEAKFPLLMTDWFHNSAYQVIHGAIPGYPTVLLNGTGNISMYDYTVVTQGRDPKKLEPNAKIPDTYRLRFDGVKIKDRAKRYLLRLINTSFDSTMIFSIDHHKLEVISADFVPIKPYNTTHLHIGIGQRYNVIVTAEPVAYPDGDKGHEQQHFWIRTTVSPCFGTDKKMPGLVGYDQTGILSYIDSTYDDIALPDLPRPDTKRWPEIPDKPKCQDEDLKNLEPILTWDVGPPSNAPYHPWNSEGGDDNDNAVGERLDVVFGGEVKPEPKFDRTFPLAKFSFEPQDNNGSSFVPMQINYSSPIFLHLDNLEKNHQWPAKWVVINENYTTDSWVYLAIAGRIPTDDTKGRKTFGAHPIHLHGHDFAILQQEQDKELIPENVKLNTTNPPRRDVVLLPANGFVVIAFKVDNPGSWIMHCHIAFHASFGLSLQVMENQDEAFEIWPNDDSAIEEAKRVCDNWKAFEGNCTKHYPGHNKKYDCYPACNNQIPKLACPNIFQDDSGI